METVFVIGAGAGVDLGLPTGSELIKNILHCISDKFSQNPARDTYDVSTLNSVIRSRVGKNDVSTRRNLEFIARALPDCGSIDTFIKNNSGNPEIVVLSKVLIAQCILHAEQKCILKPDQTEPGRLKIEARDKTWLTLFTHKLTDYANVDGIRTRIPNAAFIVFNYDRCIEVYLTHYFMNSYGMSLEEAQKALAETQILHAYGQTGKTFQNSDGYVQFGAVNPKSVTAASKMVKTLHEESEPIAKIRKLLREANRIVFLGFGFHHQNVELLTLDGPPDRKERKIFYTAFGLSKEHEMIQRLLIKSLKTSTERASFYTSNEGCRSLFEDYSISLGAPQ